MTRIIIVLTLAAIGLAIGCEAPPPPEEPTVAIFTAESPEDYERLFLTIEDTLRDHYLPPDRRDRLAGVITTERDTSAHWFEFWRPQPEPAYYWWESHLQTIQRQAEVEINPLPREGDYEVGLEVNRYRHNLEERQVDNAAGAMRLYSRSTPTYRSEALYGTAVGRRDPRGQDPGERGYWSLLGRDAFMERRLMTAIAQAYDRPQADAYPEPARVSESPTTQPE